MKKKNRGHWLFRRRTNLPEEWSTTQAETNEGRGRRHTTKEEEKKEK